RARQVDWWVIDVTNSRTRGFTDDRDNPLRATPPYALWRLGDTVLVATDPPPQPTRPAEAEFGGMLRLERYDARPTSNGLNVRLGWKVVRPPPGDLVRRLEVLSADGATLGVNDGPAGA